MRLRSGIDGAQRLLRGRGPGHASAPAREVEAASRRLLMYFVVPAWIAAGFLDYLQHRRTRIEENAGTTESVIHSLMLIEAGVPSVLGLFSQVNAGVLASSLVAVAAHEITAIYDVSYATGRRAVEPKEQHIHSLLEILPFTATAFLFALHPDQARTLLPGAHRRRRFALQAKRPPLPRWYPPSVLAALGAFLVLPYGEELWRCSRHRTRTGIER